ncbi:MAG: hypothetical protein NTY99_00800 [DPANN group archaeon]|nr:hypothetical protein [DPANN group archaeon]
METAKKMEGEAYALFKGSADEAEIRNYLPVIKIMACVPSKLELALTAGIVDIKDNIFISARKAGLNYTLKANLAGAGNHETAEELSQILNGLSAALYKPGEKFQAAVCYEESGKYKLFDEKGYVGK